MKRSALIAFALVCAGAASASAEVTGNVELIGEVTGISGQKAKFNEYRDIGGGMFGNFMLGLSHEGYYLDMKGENFGYNVDSKDAYNNKRFALKGGNYENIKFSLLYDEIPHNFTYGGRIFFTGAGSNVMVSPVAANAQSSVANAAAYYPIDYKLERTNKGAGFEISAKTPFFLSVKADVMDVKGTIPYGIYNTNAKEVPAPIDYSTQTFNLEAGYRTNRLTATVDGQLSQFSNSIPTFSISNAGVAKVITLAPENNYYKVGGSLRYNAPFWNTVLMARGTHSESENGIPIEGTLNSYSGKLTYTTASGSIVSNPVKNLDTRIFVNFLDKQNESSSDFQYGNAITERFSYHKINSGLDVAYKLPAKTTVSGGYEYLNLSRSIRTDAVSTEDHIFYGQLKNQFFHWMNAKVRYQHIIQESDNLDPMLYGTDPTSAGIYANWRPVDAANKNQDLIKFGLELEPAHGFSVGAEYIFKNTDYNKTMLGVRQDKRNELYVDANYAVGMFKFNPYFDLEFVDVTAMSRAYTPTPGDPPPAAPPPNSGSTNPAVSNATNYNWISKRADFNYAIGINCDAEVIKEKMNVGASYRYERVEGTEDFSTSAILATPIARNGQVDNYEKQTLTAKVGYVFTKNLKADVSYLYERLNYSDTHWANYVLNPAQSVNLTGAYANPNYEAHVGFMKLMYSF